MTLSTIYGGVPTVQSRQLIAGLYYFQRVGFSVVILGLSVSLAAADPAKRMFNIEAKPATQSLTDYARQAHSQLGYDVDVVDDILTNRVVGEYDSAEALELLLEDTGLKAEHGERGIFVRRVPKREVGSDIEERTPPVAGTNSLQFAQTSAAEAQATGDRNQTSRRTETDSGEDEKKRPLEEIIVTGTNIRGIAPDSSPTRTFDREDIQISGAATAQDFIQKLPANFRGGSNENFRSLPNDANAGFNSPSNAGTLGSSVNLRGLGSGSTLVLLNGHRLAPSSGIGDFVDISMIPASAIERIEVLSDGASSIYGADAVAGVVNFVLRDDFDGAEAAFRYGTVTEGDMNEYRGSVTGGKSWDSGNALFVYEYFNQDNLNASDRTFSQGGLLPADLLPSESRHSVLGSASQELAPNLRVSADTVYSKRESMAVFTNSSGTFSSELTPENINISASAEWKISDAWFVDLSGIYSELQSRVDTSGPLTFVRETDSDMWAVDAKTSGPILRLPGGNVKLAIGAHYRDENFTNFDVQDNEIDRQADRNVYAFFAEAFVPIVGTENEIPGIERLELNASGRFDNLSDFGSVANPKVGVLWSPFGSLKLRGSYSKSFKPPPLGRVGATDFFGTAVRTSFLNSALGLTPADPSIADVVQIDLFGTAKNLDAETSKAFTAGLDFNKEWGHHNLTFTSTWFDIEFENRLDNTPMPDNRFTFDAPNIAFNNPALLPMGTVIFSPAQDEITSIINSVDRPFAPPDSLFQDPFDAEIINFAAIVRNLSLTFVRGFDFDIAYTYDSSIGRFLLGLDSTYLADFQQQASVTTPLVEQLNTQFNPIDLNLRGRFEFTRNGFAANIFINYADDYRVDNTASAARIDSWTTVDLSLAYATKEKARSSMFDGLVLRLSVLNLFDEGPPSTLGNPGFGIFGYDSTNASPLNRFIAFEMRKRF